jgi:hypothetical protein
MIKICFDKTDKPNEMPLIINHFLLLCLSCSFSIRKPNSKYKVAGISPKVFIAIIKVVGKNPIEIDDSAATKLPKNSLTKKYNMIRNKR